MPERGEGGPRKLEKGPTKEPTIPIGEGGELGEILKKYGYFGFFKKIENKLIFVNDKANIPPELLKELKEGEESSLGLFLWAVKEHGKEEPKTMKEGGLVTMGIWPKHLRTITWKWTEKDCIDLKGIGSISEEESEKTGKPHPSGGYYGLLGSGYAFFEYKISEELLLKGIRTPSILAIIELKKIIIGGEEISVEEAREKGIIAQEFQPVIEVRGFGTRARIGDVSGPSAWPEEEIRKLMVEDAKRLVSQETGKDLSNDKKYLEWFAWTLGQNLGLLHKNGYLHNNLTDHNITLDCQFVDFDTACKFTPDDEQRLYKDKRNAINSFSFLVNEQLVLLKKKLRSDFDAVFYQYRKKFEESYDAVFSSEERR